MGKGIRRRPQVDRRPGSAAARPSWQEWAPPWLSAIAAVVGVIATVFGIGAITRPSDSSEHTSADLVGTSIVIGPEGIRGEGTYVSLQPAREEILVMARPEDASEPYTWVHVQAEREPERVDADAGIEDGAWEAVIPVPDINEEWRVVVGVVEAGLQGIGTPEALREVEEEGPEADIVVEAGAPIVVSPSD